jgi:hypothetical protein
MTVVITGNSRPVKLTLGTGKRADKEAASVGAVLAISTKARQAPRVTSSAPHRAASAARSEKRLTGCTYASYSQLPGADGLDIVGDLFYEVVL